MATHSSILAWEILWTEAPGGLQSMRLQESDMPEWLKHRQHWECVLLGPALSSMSASQPPISWAHPDSTRWPISEAGKHQLVRWFLSTLLVTASSKKDVPWWVEHTKISTLCAHSHMLIHLPLLQTSLALIFPFFPFQIPNQTSIYLLISNYFSFPTKWFTRRIFPYQNL